MRQEKNAIAFFDRNPMGFFNLAASDLQGNCSEGSPGFFDLATVFLSKPSGDKKVS